jgi:DNA adenine methylase
MFKPPLKWAGGKRWLVSQLKPLWEENITRRYVEPFYGTAERRQSAPH